MPRRIPSYRPPGMGDRRSAELARQRHYSRHRRDRDTKRFYDSAAWQKVRAIKLELNPLCEECEDLGLVVEAVHVHHVEPLRTRPDLALSVDNLKSLCNSCHSRIEAGGRA